MRAMHLGLSRTELIPPANRAGGGCLTADCSEESARPIDLGIESKSAENSIARRLRPQPDAGPRPAGPPGPLTASAAAPAEADSI